MEQQKPVQAVNSNDSATHRNEKKFPRMGDPATKDFSGSQGEQLASELVKAKMKLHEESIARQAAEQALRESEHRFQTFIEAIPQQVWTAGPDGTLDYVNNRVLQYFNRAFDEMIGWGWKGIIHQDDLPMCLKLWADARRTGEPYEMKFRLQRGSDGAYLWHVGRALPVHDEKGRIIKWFGTNTEITAFKVIEENLVRLNQQKKLILESVGEGIYGLDLKGRTTFVNPAAAKMIGWNLQDLLGKSLHAVLHHTRPDGTPYPPEECPIYAALKDGMVHHVDHEVFWRKDGTSFPVEYTSTPIWEEGTLKGAVVTFLDITERKQAEEQLRKSEASLAHAQRIAHLGSWEWNMADNSEVWSDEQYRIFGYRPEEIGPSYQHFLDAVHPHDRERVLAAVRATVHDDAPYDIEFRIVRQDKAERVIHAQGQVLRDSQDKPVRMIGTVLDITKRRRSKALLEGEKETLEMITKGAGLARILHRICQMVEDHSDGMLCSILILEGKRLRHKAAPSLPDSYNQKIDGMTIGANTGSCGTAAFRKEPVFVSDIAKDPLWERYKDLALPHGLVACWSTPFYSSKGSVLGTFALYYTQPRSSDRETQGLVKFWANLAGIAVERQQSEDLLRASEEKFRTVTQSANDAIISADAQGLITSWNPAAQVMFAYEEREILGRPLAELMPERYRDAHRMGLERLKNPGAKRQLQRVVELHGLRKNGSEFPLELSLSNWEMKGASFFTGIIRDITERKQAEEQLRKSEASLAHAQRIAHLGSWEWNMADDSEVWSDEQYRIFGYRPEEIGPSYQRFLDAVHPHDRERVLAAVEATVHDDAPYDIEFRIVRQDKAERVIHAQGQVLRDSHNKPVRMIGTVLDITERKQGEEAIQKAHDQLEGRVQQRTAEWEHTNRQLLQEIADRQHAQEQLRQSEDHLQALLAALPELIILYREDGTFLDIRLGSGVTTQLIPEECQGKRVDQVLPVELAEYIFANIQRALETKKIQISEYETLRNGKTENYEVRFIAKGESEVVSVVQNISERKRMQEQICEYTNNLERVIKKRTTEIKQLEIQQMRNEKLAALGQLAAGVAHEINNPLAGVSNGFAMIKDFVPQDSPGFQYVRIVERGIDRMTKTIEHMYQLYGPRVEDLKLVNVGTVVKDVLQLLEKQLNQRDLQVVTEAPPDLSGIYLSGTMLDQVLTNLIQNAIEASPRGSEVKIQAKTEGDSLRLSVTDSGSGISPELCPRIFEPFFTTKAGQQKPSMGLGLSVSNSLVEAMGGRIEVDTKFGEGSTFTVVIPMNTSVSQHRGQARL